MLHFFPVETISPFFPVKIEKKVALSVELSQNSDVFSPTLPTLPMIFNDHSWTATLSAQRMRTVIATGDVIPSRSVNYQATRFNNFTWAFEKIADTVKNADITFINLETPLLDDCPVTQEGMIFCGSSRHIEGLVLSGVDVASLGNNHAGNHGVAGVEETVDHLVQKGIKVTGIDGPEYIEVRGVRFAFLGYNDITAPQPGVSNTDEEKIKGDIQEARQHADVVIVTYHWGVEYRSQPDDRQKYLGHFTIDSGADLVIGNHPHWIQPIEIYKGKLITSAHGNFVFDQMWSEKTKEGVIGRYTFYDNQLIDVEYIPLKIKDYGQPYFLEGLEKQRILGEMRSETDKLSLEKD